MLNPQTSLSLLNRLRSHPDDEQSWNRFVALYGPKIKGWCVGWGVQGGDADDITQNVLMAIIRQIESFRYDPNGRFRSWLKTIAYRAWVDFLDKSNKNPARPSATGVPEALDSIAVQDEFLAKMDEQAERFLLDEAMINVRRRVKDQTWRAFELSAIEGLPGVQVAKDLELPISSVYKAKERVQTMLQAEVRRLDQEFFSFSEELPSKNDAGGE